MIIKNIALLGALSLMLAACTQESTTSSDTDDAGSADSTETAELTSLEQRFSYVFGMNVGEQLQQMQSQEVEIDFDVFIQGIRDLHEGNPARLSEEEVQLTIENFQNQQREKQTAMQAEQTAEREAAGAANVAEGAAFLAANAEKEGVVTLPSGLQYKIIIEGTGPKPSAEDKVTVHYRGTLLDGTEFDSSYQRNQPATFGLGQVIAGWTEGVQLMPEGSTFEFYIPPALAYGANGSGPTIGPNATLIFEVELLKAKAE